MAPAPRVPPILVTPRATTARWVSGFRGVVPAPRIQPGGVGRVPRGHSDAAGVSARTPKVSSSAPWAVVRPSSQNWAILPASNFPPGRSSPASAPNSTRPRFFASRTAAQGGRPWASSPSDSLMKVERSRPPARGFHHFGNRPWTSTPGNNVSCHWPRGDGLSGVSSSRPGPPADEPPASTAGAFLQQPSGVASPSTNSGTTSVFRAGKNGRRGRGPAAFH